MTRICMLCVAISFTGMMAVAQQKTSIKKDTMAHYDYPQVFTVVDQMPEFPGGQQEMYQFIKKNIQFPRQQDSTFTGGCKTYIKLIVDSTGKVTDPAVLKGCQGCTACDAEAIRVIRLMPNWKPGVQNGRKVNVYYYIPFNFTTK